MSAAKLLNDKKVNDSVLTFSESIQEGMKV